MIRFNRAIANIKVMSFDLDDTLYNNHPIIKAALDAQAVYLKSLPNWPSHDPSFWLACREQVASAQPQLLEDVTLWRQAALLFAMKKLGFSDTDAEQHAQRAYQAFADARSQVSVTDDVLALLNLLSKKYRLIAITNGNVEVDKFNLKGVFEHVLQAGPDGKAKPNKALFDKAAATLKVSHNEILHIGDSLDTDVQGANNAGCKSVWLNNQAIDYSYKGLADVEISDIMALSRFC